MECLQCKASTSLEWKCTRMFMVEYVRACIGQQFLHRNFVVCCVNIYCVILVCSFIPKSHFSRPELYQSLFSSSIEIALKLGKRKSWKVDVFALKNWRWKPPHNSKSIKGYRATTRFLKNMPNCWRRQNAQFR